MWGPLLLPLFLSPPKSLGKTSQPHPSGEPMQIKWRKWARISPMFLHSKELLKKNTARREKIRGENEANNSLLARRDCTLFRETSWLCSGCFSYPIHSPDGSKPRELAFQQPAHTSSVSVPLALTTRTARTTTSSTKHNTTPQTDWLQRWQTGWAAPPFLRPLPSLRANWRNPQQQKKVSPRSFKS